MDSPNTSTCVAFNNESYFGFTVEFAEKDFGFGTITLSVNKQTGEPRCDLETISPDHCGELLMRTVGTKVQRYEFPDY